MVAETMCGVGLAVGRQPSKLIYTGSIPVPRFSRLHGGPSHHWIAEPALSRLHAPRKTPQKSIRAGDRHAEVVPVMAPPKRHRDRPVAPGLDHDHRVAALVAVVPDQQRQGHIRVAGDTKFHVASKGVLQPGRFALNLHPWISSTSAKLPQKTVRPANPQVVGALLEP